MLKETTTNIFHNNKKIFTIIHFAVLTICFVMIFRIVDFNDILNSILSVPSSVIILSLGIYIMQTWFVSLRWRILNNDTYKQFNQMYYFRYMMMSNFFNLFMPGTLGGDLARGMLLFKRLKNQRATNIIAILADRCVGLFSILLFGTLSTFTTSYLPEREKYLWILVLLLAGFILSLALVSSNQFIDLIKFIFKYLGRFGDYGTRIMNSWQNAISYYSSYPWKILLAFVICIPIHFSTFIIVYLFAISMNINLPFFTICTITSIAWIISTIPLSFSGLGIRELSYAYLLSLQGISSDKSIALSLAQFGAYVIVGIMGILFIIHEFAAFSKPSDTSV